MFDFDRWQSENELYLSQAMDWLRSRLQLVGGDAASSVTNQFPSSDDEYSSALEVVAVRFGLSDFETKLLFVCAAMEFDTRIPAMYSKAQGDLNRPYPTFGLCFSLLDDAAWDAMSPDRPLRKYRLIEIERHAQLPLTASPLRADDRIVSFLKGLNHLDERLSLLLRPVEDHANDLPESQQQVADQAIQAISEPEREEIPSIQLLGTDHETKRQIASAICHELAVQLYRISSDLLPSEVERIEEFATLWTRESNLTPVALYIDAADTTDANVFRNISQLLSRISGVAFIDCSDKQAFEGDQLILDIGRPTVEEQITVWQEKSCMSPDEVAMIAGQFDLNLPAIERVSNQLAEETAFDSPSQVSRFWNSCRQSTRPKLNELAQRIDCKSTWDEIVLPNEEASLLRQITSQVRNRGIVLDEWGFRESANRGLGVTALFSGESGTGKTMAAEVIANDLELDLYRIDLSSVINKYIGETEKNLRKLFDAAEAGGVILFFDEADALFGKRSEVKDSHDRFANIEVNYLLQRMESYRGLAILATNNKRSLDTAFLRRLRFVVDFQFPEVKQRRKIWQRIFPTATPLSGIDYNHLAKLRLTGGNIYNIALNAAFAAASDRPAVDMPSILTAAKSEMVKTQTPMNTSEFIWHGQGVAS